MDAKESEKTSERLYQPKEGEKEFTIRSLIVGCLLGSVVSIINIYFGLQTGWTVGASLIAAILSYAIFAILPLKTPYGVLENNISETAGSAAGGMSAALGLVSVMPALHMMGYEMPMSTLYCWGFSIAFMGVFFAIPLRRQMIIVDKLRFPTGTATAETIIAMHLDSDEYTHKASVLMRWSVFASIMTLLTYFVTPLQNIPVLTAIGFSAASAWGFTLLMSPMMVGAGMIMGVRIGFSLFLGAFLSWGLIGPALSAAGWVSGDIHNYKTGVQGWILWPGVSMMLADSLMVLVLSWRSILRSFRFSKPNSVNSSDQIIPFSWWITGMCFFSCLTIISMRLFFSIPIIHTAIALVLSFVLSMIAVRAAGETDINPITAVGKVTQLVYGVLAPGKIITNLLEAGVTSAGAVSAGDMMQDLKTGYLLGASPRKQFIAQMWGAFTGIIISVPIYSLFKAAYHIGEGNMPAPAGHAWHAMAQLLTVGLSALPPHALFGIIIGALLGAVIPVIRLIPKISPFVPSGMAVGIAFLVAAYYTTAMFLGSVIYLIWSWRSPKSAEGLLFAVASGLIVGEGLMGVVKAILTLFGVEPLI